MEIGSTWVQVHGPMARRPAPDLVEAALDWIDDPVGLVDGRPVPSTVIWRDLILASAGAQCGALTVVYPDDWPLPRVNRVRSAAEAVAVRPVLVTRDRWNGGTRRRVRLLGWPAILRPAIWRPALAVVLVAVVAAALAGRYEGQPSPAAVSLVQGRVAVLIPSDWTVGYLVDGPGSPRVLIGSPDDSQTALNITWAHAPGITLAETAETLRRVAVAEPVGVFDFALSESGGSRPAVTYREMRPGRVVRWAVFIDGVTRIAVGCQGAPGRLITVLGPCLQAVRSAREVPF